MDRKEEQSGSRRWSWLPAQMPGVAAQLADKRRELGADWINLCWRRGVVDGLPDWFFAAEGRLMVGTLGQDPALIAVVQNGLPPGQALVVLRNKGAGDGTAG